MSNLLLISSSKANLEKRNRKKNCPTFQFVHEAEAAHCFEGIEVGQEAHETGIEREASKINYFVDVVLESNEYIDAEEYIDSQQYVDSEQYFDAEEYIEEPKKIKSHKIDEIDDGQDFTKASKYLDDGQDFSKAAKYLDDGQDFTKAAKYLDDIKQYVNGVKQYIVDHRKPADYSIAEAIVNGTGNEALDDSDLEFSEAEIATETWEERSSDTVALFASEVPRNRFVESFYNISRAIRSGLIIILFRHLF